MHDFFLKGIIQVGPDKTATGGFAQAIAEYVAGEVDIAKGKPKAHQSSLHITVKFSTIKMRDENWKTNIIIIEVNARDLVRGMILGVMVIKFGIVFKWAWHGLN